MFCFVIKQYSAVLVSSWDEMAQRDLPATVDKILSTTGAEDLFYVGHSQGGAIGYGGFSFNASIARKIRMFAALAPAVYVKDMISPVGKLTPFSRDFIVSTHVVKEQPKKLKKNKYPML